MLEYINNTEQRELNVGVGKVLNTKYLSTKNIKQLRPIDQKITRSKGRDKIY